MYSKVFFDCDSTLITIEACDLLAEYCGVGEEVRRMTAASMNGKILVEEVAIKKINLMKPRRELVDRVVAEVLSYITPGAEELVGRLQSLGSQVYIISSGYMPVLKRIADHLRIPIGHVYGNELFFHADGTFLGIDQSSLLIRQNGKALTVAKIVAPEDKSVFVGDGSTDVQTKGVVDCFIGYGGVVTREKVRAAADAYVSEPNILSLLPILSLRT